MPVKDIEAQIYSYYKRRLSLFATTSMQTHSVVLLHILSKMNISIPIFFVNTGFHFPETIVYKEQIMEFLKIKIEDVFPDMPKWFQRDSNGSLLFATSPDDCCYYNKVQPLEKLMLHYDVWINGVRHDQTEQRKQLQVEQMAVHNTLRFHPMLQWNENMINEYIIAHNIPRHPLEIKGYQSIGCEPCTRKLVGAVDRESRWYGLKKEECGINTDLLEQ